MTADENLSEGSSLRDRIAEISWFHTMELAPGIWTPGEKGGPNNGTRSTLEQIHLPEDLTGKSVLDVGAWDGFYSFEAERRGASRVLATDSYCWSSKHPWASKHGFKLAREVLGSRVEDLDIDPLDLSVERVGVWDVVLFLGVLYHLKNPLEVLKRVAAVTSELLILETHVDLRVGNDLPAAVFYPGTELQGDCTNWWGPNSKCLEAMLRTVGFERIRFFTASGPAADGVTAEHAGASLFAPGVHYDRLVAHCHR